MRLLNETARKNGFADYADYRSVAVNIVWILTGIDPLSKKYVGVQSVTKQEAAILLSDKALSPHDHKLPVRYATCANADGRPDKIRGECVAGDQILRQAYHAGCGEGLVARPDHSRAQVPRRSSSRW